MRALGYWKANGKLCSYSIQNAAISISPAWIGPLTERRAWRHNTLLQTPIFKKGFQCWTRRTRCWSGTKWHRHTTQAKQDIEQQSHGGRLAKNSHQAWPSCKTHTVLSSLSQSNISPVDHFSSLRCMYVYIRTNSSWFQTVEQEKNTSTIPLWNSECTSWR